MVIVIDECLLLLFFSYLGKYYIYYKSGLLSWLSISFGLSFFVFYFSSYFVVPFLVLEFCTCLPASATLLSRSNYTRYPQPCVRNRYMFYMRFFCDTILEFYCRFSIVRFSLHRSYAINNEIAFLNKFFAICLFLVFVHFVSQ